MMPLCDYSRPVLLWTYHCHRIATHLRSGEGFGELSACDKHEAWYWGEVTKREGVSHGRSND